MLDCYKTVGRDYAIYTRALVDSEAVLVNVKFSKKVGTWSVPKEDCCGRTIVKWEIESPIGDRKFWPDTIIVPDTISQLEGMRFLPCQTIVMPNNLKTVSASQFDSNKSLEKIVLSKATKSIGFQAFNNCGLSESPCNVIIPNNCEEISEFCFFLSNLGYLRWPENTHRIPSRCFTCASIECLDLSGATILEVGKSAFAKTEIRELRLPYFPLSNAIWQELRNAEIGKIV